MAWTWLENPRNPQLQFVFHERKRPGGCNHFSSETWSIQAIAKSLHWRRRVLLVYELFLPKILIYSKLSLHFDKLTPK